MRRWVIAAMVALLVGLPVMGASAAEGDRPPVELYSATELVLTKQPPLVQGEVTELEGYVVWAASKARVENGLLLLIVHFPLGPDGRARVTDPVGFTAIGSDGWFRITVTFPPVLWAHEQYLDVEGQFNVLTFIPNILPSLSVIGTSEHRQALVVRRG